MNAYEKAAKPTATPAPGRSQDGLPRHFVDFSLQVPAFTIFTLKKISRSPFLHFFPSVKSPDQSTNRRKYLQRPTPTTKTQSKARPAPSYPTLLPYVATSLSHQTPMVPRFFAPYREIDLFRSLHFPTPPPFSPVQISPARKKFSSAPASCTFAPTQFAHVPSVKGCGGFEP
jgi:hypothetical protein